MSTTRVMTVEEMYTDEGHKKWLELRKTGLGGTDASVIVGLNKYKTVFSLWMEKTNQLEEDGVREVSDDGKERMYWGTKLEDLIATKFEEDTGKKVRRCGMLRSNEYPWMFADVDRLVIGENAIVECKTTASWNKDEWADDNIPDAYYCQVQHYMAVGGWDKAYVICLIGGQHMVVREVPRNEDDIEALIKAEETFWNENVLANKMPPPDGSSACEMAIRKKFQGGGSEACELSGEWDGIIDQISDLKEQITKLETQKKEKENKLRLEMENSEFGRTPKYNIWYKTVERKGYDTKALARDYPNIVEKYQRSSYSRPLNIKISKARNKEGEIN